jgi:hypothetical protein
MAPHDPLFKRLLRMFFHNFVELVAPEIAGRLDLSAPVFLDKEFPSPGPPEKGRVVDLLVRVPLQDDKSKALLVHVEIEAQARKGMGKRLKQYHHLIRTLHDEQILSIALYLRGGKRGIREEVLEEDLTGPGLSAFRFLAIGLEKCSAREYLAKPEPLAWALASIMDPRPWSRARLKLGCLQRVREATLKETERIELVKCIETYLQLTPREAEEHVQLSSPRERSAGTMNLLYIETWEDRIEARGARKVVLGLLEERFGAVPEEVRQRLDRIRSVDRLTRLAHKALTAKSLKSLRLG